MKYLMILGGYYGLAILFEVVIVTAINESNTYVKVSDYTPWIFSSLLKNN